MTNSPNNRLDEFVKNSMQNHEVPFNEAHWNEFEAKLNSKPRVNTIRNWSFSMNTFIGLVMIGSVAALSYIAISMSSATVENTKGVVKTNVPVNTNISTPVQNTTAAPIVINTLSDNNTYSIFTSAEISGTNDMVTEQVSYDKPLNSYSGISNTNGVLQNTIAPNLNANNTSGGKNLEPKTDAGDQISPEQLKQILQDAKDANANSKVLFPDQINKKYGNIYPTKEVDTMKNKAEQKIEDSPFYNGNDGKANADSLKLFFENAQKKIDSGSVNPPIDSLKSDPK